MYQSPFSPSMNAGCNISISSPTLVIIGLFYYSNFRRCEVVLWFSFSWWLMMLNTFSHSHWSSLKFWSSLWKVFCLSRYFPLSPLHLIHAMPAPKSFFQISEYAVTGLVHTCVISISFLTFSLFYLVRADFMRLYNSMELYAQKGSVV